MSNYEASVFNITDGYTNRHEGRRQAAMAAVEVRPPFVVGEGFKDTVLGQDKNGIHLEHIYTSDTATAFVVEASLYDADTHVQMIHTVSMRIAELLNRESSPVAMRADNPFPHPYSIR